MCRSGMTDARSLKEAIEQYEIQLSQVDATLSTTPKGPYRDNLLSLKSDINELIFLTKESLQSLEENVENTNEDNPDDKTEDLLDKEYVFFKAELEKSSNDNKDEQDNKTIAASGSIEDELKELEGTKCKAPHSSTWGGIGYHNAMICSVYKDSGETIKDIHDIKVRVFFLNPIYKEMIPCPYFLNGSCKFSDENCHYCHGKIVPFSSLQEYKEPDFHNIKIGSKVLTKQKNNMWYRSIVLKLPEKNGDEYRVKFESSGKIVEAGLQDLLPLDDTNLEMSNTFNDSNNDDEDTNNVDNELQPNSYINNQLVHKSLLTLQSTNEALGNWEKHTRGIGSKLMMQMGYVIGSGLGKRSDGRIEPVETQILPAGKSLDYCMELREFAGDDKDLFSAERNMRKQQQKLEQQREREYQKQKQKDDNDVFNFINKALSDKPEENIASSLQSKDKLKTESNRNLNVASFQIGEHINRLERESLKLKESLTKHAKGSVFYNSIAMKYNEKQKELTNLRASEKNIVAEQNQRKNKVKLSIF
ncbi:PREDICTED: zinc finger CCCH-type with G patch domain-containing protein [Acromyrmex echinatior]|uniref:zinc finger CCCH-type with G patch domain-containing protein n=1 Tax=Acromyrmex echinatior TaxID=103372 RepID=UPI000580E84B|nr:PREDICTED: zinc finger CCCH-type with G patch domain-containing protein [Acromyrmex echinatior]